MQNEEKGTCCGKCGRVHVKGTSCPRPFLTGKSHCRNRKNEDLRDPDDNPCWDGYHPVGTKQKDGRTVPNCVPTKESIEETDAYCPSCLIEYLLEYEHKIEEAEYRGRKVTLGKPFLTPDGPKKRSVYVKNAKGNVVKVNFGDPNMKIKKSIPARRKSFRARHKCSTPGPKWKARYWSCKAW
jgi:hypothetical protein